MRNVLKNLVVVITLIFTLNVTALAVTTKATVQPKKDSLTKIQIEREQVEKKIEQFDNEIGKNIIKTEENDVLIAQTEKKIKIAVEEIRAVENRAEKEEELFNSRMRIMYMNGSDSYTELLLGADSFADFVSRIEYVKIIINFDKVVVSEFKDIKTELTQKQQTLNGTKESLLRLQADNNKKLDEILLAKESQKKLITELNSKQNNIIDELIEISFNTKVIGESVPNVTPSRGSASTSENAVISYAMSFLGTPYLWAGTSPNTGFDCSGFTQYVYGYFGVTIGRSTFDQIKKGVGISREDLEPGDLVFFGSTNDPQHTGIYIGDNKYIHSPQTGDVIKISAMTRGDFVMGRRVK